MQKSETLVKISTKICPKSDILVKNTKVWKKNWEHDDATGNSQSYCVDVRNDWLCKPIFLIEDNPNCITCHFQSGKKLKQSSEINFFGAKHQSGRFLAKHSPPTKELHPLNLWFVEFTEEKYSARKQDYYSASFASWILKT